MDSIHCDFISLKYQNRLNEEQKEVVEFVEKCHNMLISGAAGTGKSFLVKAIVKKLHELGKSVVVICSSGLSCTVYDNIGLNVSTVHSHYGLQTADLPHENVIKRALANNLVRERVKQAETIIWDEASMSSERVLQLANAIQREVAGDEECMFGFAGKQVLIVGDFLQLRPVPSEFDEGRFMFESALFKEVIPHTFSLSRVMRQDEGDLQFLSALHDLRVGETTPETSTFLTSLSR